MKALINRTGRALEKDINRLSCLLLSFPLGWAAEVYAGAPTHLGPLLIQAPILIFILAWPSLRPKVCRHHWWDHKTEEKINVRVVSFRMFSQCEHCGQERER